MNDEHEFDDGVEVDEAKVQMLNSDGLWNWAIARQLLRLGTPQGATGAHGFLQGLDEYVRDSIAKYPGAYDVQHLSNMRSCLDAALIDQVNHLKAVAGKHGELMN